MPNESLEEMTVANRHADFGPGMRASRVKDALAVSASLAFGGVVTLVEVTTAAGRRVSEIGHQVLDAMGSNR